MRRDGQQAPGGGGQVERIDAKRLARGHYRRRLGGRRPVPRNGGKLQRSPTAFEFPSVRPGLLHGGGASHTDTENWRMLRSVQVPRVDSIGRKPLFGAGMKLDDVDAMLTRQLVTGASTSVLIRCIAVVAGQLLARRVSRPATDWRAGSRPARRLSSRIDKETEDETSAGPRAWRG